MNDDNIPMKTCRGCGESKPATKEYFSRNKRMKSGLNQWCKMCMRQYQNEYRNKPENKERMKEYGSQYYQDNKERVTKRRSLYYSENKQKHSDYGRAYRMNNPESGRIKTARRRARKQMLSNSFTEQQWLACLEYFNHCCAVCGNQLRDLFGNIEPNADHWIPLSHKDCPGTVAENMVCLCNICNRAKWYNYPADWLKQEYGTRKANIILARIEAYFQFVRDNN